MIPFAASVVLFLLSPLHAWLRVAFLFSASYLCIDYLFWRLTDSLNFVEPAGPLISFVLLLAEAYGFVTLLLLWLQVGTRSKTKFVRRPAPPDFAPTVDIFIPIYSESLEILECTLVGAKALDYANKKIFVCDDSHRESVKELAEEFGAVYVKGPKRHAKAGNLNNALSMTSGELVVVFDTDHIPVTSFLKETVPLFVDEKMGIVQTPHCFYNEDIFQRAFQSGRLVGNEQDMFNHAIQSGRDTWGGAFFVGSGAVFRRAAMNEVGGFNLLSITEDIHTSQLIHSKGWKSGFVDKNLAVGLSAENLLSFLVQRRRWMLGCLQIFFKDNPLKYSSLSWRHRLGYFASLTYFFYPAARVIFWVTPMYFLLFHWHPLLTDIPSLVAHLLPFMVLRPMMNASLMPNWPRMFWGQIYEAVIAFPLFRGMFDLFLPKRLGFKVTPKGITSDTRSFDFASTTLTLLAVGISIIALAKGAWEFWYFGIEKEAYFFNMSWALFNLLFLLVTLLLAWERPQRRLQERVQKAVPVRLKPKSSSGEFVDIISDNISLSGVKFFSKSPLQLPNEAELMFLNENGLTLRANLIYQERVKRNRFAIAYQFHVETREQRRQLTQLIFTEPETWAKVHIMRTTWSLVSSFYFFKGIVLNFLPQSGMRRKHVRKKLRCHAQLKWGSLEARLAMRDVSDGGFSIFSREDLPLENEKLQFNLSESNQHFAQLVYKKRLLVGKFAYGFQYLEEGMRPTKDFFPVIQLNS